MRDLGCHSLCCIDVQSVSLLLPETNIVNDVNKDDVDEVGVAPNSVDRDENHDVDDVGPILLMKRFHGNSR